MRGLEPWTPAARANNNKRHNLEPFKASVAGDQGWEFQPPKGALGTSLEVQWLRLHVSMSSTSGWEAKIPHDLRWIPHAWRQKKKTNQKQYCNKFNTGFKNGPHKKKNLKKGGVVSRWDASISMRVGYCLD